MVLLNYPTDLWYYYYYSVCSVSSVRAGNCPNNVVGVVSISDWVTANFPPFNILSHNRAIWRFSLRLSLGIINSGRLVDWSLIFLAKHDFNN